MAKVDNALESVPEGYPGFLRERMLARLSISRTWYGGCRSSSSLAEQHSSYTFEQTLELLLAALGERASIKRWQIQ